MAIGFTLPFAKASGTLGHFEATNTPLEATRENMRSLLLTNWGERMMHYSFGCNLKEFLFEPMDVEELKQRIADRILDQTGTWLPFVAIQILNVFFPEEDSSLPENSFRISIQFTLKNDPDFSARLDVAITQ